MSSASSPNIGIGITLGGAPTVVAGLQQVQAKMVDLARETLSTKTALNLMAAAGLTLAAGAFVSILKGAIETQGAFNDLAIQTGASAEALSALAAIGKTTNTSAGDIATAMGRLAKNMAGADEESRGAAQGLIAIGLSVKDFKALKPEEQMQALAAQLAHYQDGSGKAAVAMALLGKEGARLLPYMADLALVGTLQAKVTTEQSAAADNLSDNLVRIKASSESWKKELAQGMVPALDVAAQAWLDNINGAGGLREEIKALSKDGTITEWTYNAITALTYLMDTFAMGKNAVLLIGEAYGLTAALIVEKISGLNAMMEQARKGDLAGFDAERAASKARQEAMKKDFDDRLKAAYDVEYLGAKMRAKIADLRNTPAATVAQRDELKFDPAAAAAKTAKDTEAQDLAKLLAEQAGLNGDFAKKWDLLSAAYARGTLNLAQFTEQQGVLLSKQPAMVAAKKAEIDAAKSANDAFDDYFAAQEKARLANESQIKSAREMLDSIQFEARLIGLSNTERAIAIASRDLERQGIIAGTKAYDAYIERIRTALTGKEAALANADAARQIAADWKRTAEQINASITDALMRGFESGKGFAANLRDTIANMFKTLVLRPVVQAVVGSTLGSVGSAATAANAASSMGSAGSSLGSLSSLYSAGSSLLSGGSSIMGAATNAAGTVGQNLGLSYYNGTGWSATGMGDALMTAGPYAAAALVALNALGVFRKTKQVGAGITGTLGADTELQDVKQLRKSGTLFRGPSYWKEFSDTATETETAIEAAVGGMIRSASGMAQAMGLNAGRLATFTQQLDLDTTGLSAEQASAKLAAALDAYNLALVGQIDGLSALAKAGETSAQTLQRTFGQYTQIRQAEIAIMQAQGNDTAALAAARALELIGLDASDAAFKQRLFALQDEAKAAAEAKTAADALAASLANAAQAARSTLVGALQTLQSIATDVRDSFAGAANDIRGTITRLLGGLAATPAATFAAALRQFGGIAALALGGSVSAMGQLPAAGEAAAQAALLSSASAVDYARHIAQLTTRMASVAAVADTQASAAQVQIDYAAQQLAALGEVKTSVDTVESATRAVQVAVLQLASASAADTFSRMVATGASLRTAATQAAAGISTALPAADQAAAQAALGAVVASQLVSQLGTSLDALGITPNTYAPQALAALQASTSAAQALQRANEWLDAASLAARAAGQSLGVQSRAAYAAGNSADGVSLGQQAQAAAQQYRDLRAIPYFAAGGTHLGGLRVVGERGAELEATGPARIWSAEQTRAMLAGGSGAQASAQLLDEVRGLRADVGLLRFEAQATAGHTGRIARQHERWEVDGLTVRNDADQPLVTTTVAVA